MSREIWTDNALYLDNAATTFPKPPEVLEAYVDYLRRVGASPSRGIYGAALEAGRLLFETRRAIAKIIGAPKPERVIFTKNATEALNLAIFGVVKPGWKVVTTRMEHNAVIRPLLELERRGTIEILWAELQRDGRLNLEHLFELAQKDGVRLVVTTGISNVTGVVVPFWQIGEFCRERDLIYLVDGAQLVGTYPVNVVEDCIDMLAFTGHKSLYGVPGTGGLYVGERVVELAPLLWGGTGGQSRLPDMPKVFPDGYEAGTPNTPGIVALGAGANWVLQRGVEKIHQHKQRLLRTMLASLRGADGIRLFGPQDDIDRTAIIPVVVDGQEPKAVAQKLWERYRIAVRAGLHCAPHIHEDLGAPEGTVRFSFGALNTEDDAKRAAEAITQIASEK